MFKMLNGKKVNLKPIEKEDLPILVEWFNDPEFFGEYVPLIQTSKMEMEKTFDNRNSSETKSFIIEKKDGKKIGYINHFNVIWDGIGRLTTIAYSLEPTERGKVYCTDAVKIIVDYLFLSKEVLCIIGFIRNQLGIHDFPCGLLKLRWNKNRITHCCEQVTLVINKCPHIETCGPQ